MPQGSSREMFVNESIFDLFLNNMIQFQCNFNNNCEFIVCGDFNSRIGNKPDYVENDGLHRFNLLPDDYVVDIILPRISQDKHVNENGKCLLDFCKMSGLKVLNGRVGVDCQLGKFTCVTSRGSSVIDLVMCTPLLFSCIETTEFFCNISLNG